MDLRITGHQDQERGCSRCYHGFCAGLTYNFNGISNIHEDQGRLAHHRRQVIGNQIWLSLPRGPHVEVIILLTPHSADFGCGGRPRKSGVRVLVGHAHRSCRLLVALFELSNPEFGRQKQEAGERVQLINHFGYKGRGDGRCGVLAVIS